MQNYELKDLIKDKTVSFMFYRQGELWYRVNDTTFEFPVPTDDTGNGIFFACSKAILFMRWIRKHVEMIKEARANQCG